MANAIALAFFLTSAIEVGVAWLFRWRRRDLLAVVLVNVITNIPLNTFIWGWVDFYNLSATKYPASFGGRDGRAMATLAEVFVVLIEWWLLTWATKKPRRQAFLVSLVMNVASFAIGLLIMKFL